MSKTYVLLKDLPDAKAGTELISTGASYKYESIVNGESKGALCYYKEYVENNPEWFKLKEDKIEVTEVREHSSDSSLRWIVIETNKKIPPDKYPSIKKAIEDVLNDNKYESQPISRDTWKHTDIQEQCYSSKLSYTDMKYTEKDLLDAEQRAFTEARIWDDGLWSNQIPSKFKYPTFSDFKNDTK